MRPICGLIGCPTCPASRQRKNQRSEETTAGSKATIMPTWAYLTLEVPSSNALLSNRLLTTRRSLADSSILEARGEFKILHKLASSIALAMVMFDNRSPEEPRTRRKGWSSSRAAAPGGDAKDWVGGYGTSLGWRRGCDMSQLP